MITWARAPEATWRRLATWEGVLLLAAVIVLAVVSVSINEAVTYMVFPALIWAAFRFGPAIAALSTAIAAGAGDRHHRARARSVLQASDRRQGAEHAAVHPGGSAHDARS